MEPSKSFLVQGAIYLRGLHIYILTCILESLEHGALYCLIPHQPCQLYAQARVFWIAQESTLDSAFHPLWIGREVEDLNLRLRCFESRRCSYQSLNT